MAAADNAGAEPVYDVPFLNSFKVDGDASEWGEDGLRVALGGADGDEQRLVPKDAEAADHIECALSTR